MPFCRHGFLLVPATSPIVFGAGGAHALGGLIGHDRVVNGLRALAVFDERELHFQFALVCFL